MKGWKTVIFGLLMIVAPPALTYLGGVDWTKLVGPNLAFPIAGAIAILLRMVTTTPIGRSDNNVDFTSTGRKMVIGFLIIGGSLIAFFVVAPARAADVPLPKPRPIAIKAPAPLPATTCTTNQCNVWFLGLGIYGAAANANIVGGGLNNSIFANGEMLAASVGGQFWTNGVFLGVEDMIGYAMGPPSNVAGTSASIAGGVNILWLEAGGSLGDFFGSGAQPVQINQALLSDLISPYFGTGPATVFGGGGGTLGAATFWTEGAGVRYLIPNASHPLLLDVKYLYGNNTSQSGLVSNKNFQFVGATVSLPFNW